MLANYISSLRDRIGAESFRGLKLSIVGGTLSSGILFVLSIAAGRILGPREYGAVGLIQTISMVISTFMLVGVDASIIHYASKEKDPKQVKQIISSSLSYSLVILAGVAGVSFLLTQNISGWLNVSSSLVVFAIVLGATVTLKALADGILRSLGSFKLQSTIKILEALIVAAGFVLLARMMSGYGVYIYAVILGAVCYALISLRSIRAYLSWQAIDPVLAKKVLGYGVVAVTSTVLGLVFIYLDKLLVQVSLGQQTLGLYMAYYTAAIMPISQVANMVANVFYPLAARAQDHTAVVRLLYSYFSRLLVPVIILIFLGAILVLHMFGSAYEYDLSVALLFAIWGGILFFASLFNYVIMGHSKRLFTIGLRFQLVKTLLFGAYLLALFYTSHLSISSIVVGLILANLLEMLNCTIVVLRYGGSEND